MTENERRRVVVTGMGMVVPHGRDVDTVWNRICAGESGIDRIRSFDPSSIDVQIAGEVSYPVETLGSMGPYPVGEGGFAFTVAAIEDAIEQSGLGTDGDPDRRAVVLATGVGPATLELFGHMAVRYFEEGDNLRKKELSDFYARQQADPVADELDRFFLDRAGPAACLLFGASRFYDTAAACASGSQAIADAGQLIQRGEAEVVLAGGVCTAVNRAMIPGFGKIQALSNRNDDPQAASRPFDADRDGFVMAEGASVLVLEELQHARARGATIYAELKGWGYSADSYRLTDPHPEGTGMALSMTRAIEHAGIKPEEISYINAHGTSTPYNDAAETKAIKIALGEEIAKRVPVSSTKGMTGHLIHAAGSTEAIFCTKAINSGLLPPTVNYTTPDPGCDLDYIPNESREADVKICMSNSFGFGGQNVTVILARMEGEES